MDKRSLTLWIVIGVLALLVVYVIFFQSPSGATGQAVASAGRAGTSAASSGMVGGC
ncbi:MAG: hypothetical protein ACE5ES_04595 [Candidatus Nanoarchaeia archaeon]